jgi:hypothetical protein
MPQTVSLPASQDARALRRQSFLLWCLFILALQELSVMIGVSGVQVGYLFLLILLFPYRRTVLTEPAVAVLAVYAVVFLAGAPELLTGDANYSIRTTASFLAFLAPLLLLLVKFEERDLDLFKSAVIWAAVYYSLSSLYAYATAVGFGLSIFTLKFLVGSQRYGFVLLLAFFLAIYSTQLKGLVKTAVISILFFGALLTFSRATLVSLAGAGLFAVLTSGWRIRIGLGRLRWSSVARAVLIVATIAALGVLAAESLGEYWRFINERLIRPAMTGQLLTAFWSFNYQSSEGARAYLTALIFDYVAAHPWTGSNYAGLYLIYDELNGRGSAHNQLTDVLFRTGAVGFALYLWLLGCIILFFRRDRAILVGLVAVLIYGMFHETFKLGHGGFIFGFLLSYQFWMRRQRAMRGSSSPLVQPADRPGLPSPTVT